MAVRQVTVTTSEGTLHYVGTDRETGAARWGIVPPGKTSLRHLRPAPQRVIDRLRGQRGFFDHARVNDGERKIGTHGRKTGGE